MVSIGIEINLICCKIASKNIGSLTGWQIYHPDEGVSVATVFNIEEHHQFVSRHGETVQYKKAYLCPCGTTPDPARVRPDCFLCFGRGQVYASALPMVGMVTAIKREKELLEAGIAQPGDLVFSPSPKETRMLSEGDVIELGTWSGQPFQGELIKRARGGLVDMLAYPPVTIQRCFTVDQSAQTQRDFTSPTHFSVNGKLLTWTATAANRPLADQVYSLAYTARVEWVVFLPPQDRIEGAVNLGQKVMLRARHAIQAREG